MEIAGESGLGTTLSGDLMVANRPLATPAVLAIPISRHRRLTLYLAGPDARIVSGQMFPNDGEARPP
jgi:hypothetical protein